MPTKVCAGCRLEKDLEAFNFKHKALGTSWENILGKYRRRNRQVRDSVRELSSPKTAKQYGYWNQNIVAVRP